MSVQIHLKTCIKYNKTDPMQTKRTNSEVAK